MGVRYGWKVPVFIIISSQALNSALRFGDDPDLSGKDLICPEKLTVPQRVIMAYKVYLF